MRLSTAIVFELAYILFSRTWLRQHFSGVELEILVTFCRVASLSVYWLLFRDFLSKTAVNCSTRPTIWLFCGIASLLMVPLLFNGGYPADKTYRVVFALTSAVVALREEFFYRGVIQTVLERRFGFFVALIASNVLFVFYHYGAQPLTATGIIEIFTMGCVLGLMYGATGTLWAPIALHAAYDSMWSLGPIIANPPPDVFRIPFFAFGGALLLYWASAYVGRRRTAG